MGGDAGKNLKWCSYAISIYHFLHKANWCNDILVGNYFI